MINTFKQRLAHLRNDEQGGAVIEYALIAGLIIIGCISLIAVFGNKVLARWNSVNTSSL